MNGGARKRQKIKKSQILLAIVLFACLGVIAAVLWWFYDNTKQTSESIAPVGQAQNDTVTVEDVPKDVPAAATETELFDTAGLQKIVEDWGAAELTEDSKASVVLMGEDGEIYASFKQDTEFFAASIYKLYVAYEGYKQVDAKTVNPTEQYQGGRTRLQCLDAMIRTSDSPCAEKLWIEIGKAKLTETLKGYGIENTSMSDISTTAEDAAKILQRISTGEGLSSDSQAAYLASMKDQPALYRKGLPSGFTEAVTVYNKVGWNEQLEYHDAAILELADGRKLIAVVLTSGVGTGAIRELATQLEAALISS